MCSLENNHNTVPIKVKQIILTISIIQQLHYSETSQRKKTETKNFHLTAKRTEMSDGARTMLFAREKIFVRIEKSLLQYFSESRTNGRVIFCGLFIPIKEF